MIVKARHNFPLRTETRTNRHKKLLEVNKYTGIKLFAGLSMN